jgi:hypothetical protein
LFDGIHLVAPDKVLQGCDIRAIIGRDCGEIVILGLDIRAAFI